MFKELLKEVEAVNSNFESNLKPSLCLFVYHSLLCMQVKVYRASFTSRPIIKCFVSHNSLQFRIACINIRRNDEPGCNDLINFRIQLQSFRTKNYDSYIIKTTY